MIISHYPARIRAFLANSACVAAACRAIALVALVGSVAMPGVAAANEHAEPVIRLKLHSVEDLTAEPAKAPPVSDEAAELKKQAQTKYLATKLKKSEAAVRKFVDLAWAEAAKREKLNPELIIAIIKKESGFRPQVQSPYGAQGLMQVVRRWHGEKLRPSESLFDPEVNIRVGADVLEEYLALAKGDLDVALRKYSGNARGYVNTVLKESRMLAQVGEQAARRAQMVAFNTAGEG